LRIEMVEIGNSNLTLENFIKVVRAYAQVELTQAAVDRIVKSRQIVDEIVESKAVVYGLSTGFGSLKDKSIPPEKLDELQINLIRSHAVGVGEAAPTEVVRGMMLLRLTCISNGYSGVRLQVAEKLVEALNKNFIPYVPIQGTVGASGDLAPLSHMILSLLGESTAYDVETKSYVDSKIVLTKLGMEPMPVLKAKEGLALNNGTQFITSYTALALHDALRLMKIANFAGAMSVEALHGVSYAFESVIHEARPHEGQIAVASDIRSYLKPNGAVSEIATTHTKGKVQDAYSLRCMPQIHGAAHDLLQFCLRIITTEMNGVNDNPLIINDKSITGTNAISGGNFHAQYPAMAADQIAYAVTLLCNNSERRTERMVNHSLNGFMPSFLTNNPGLNSGAMIVQYGAAGVTAENRQLTNPASVHSIPTCEGSEDIVSMGGWSARKARQAVENAFKVIGYEMFVGCQALDFTKEKPHDLIEKLHCHVRQNVPKFDDDVYMKPSIDWFNNFIYSGDVDAFLSS
jgi:histidine ammonia-lyase